MAIDTAAKRASAMAIGMGSMGIDLPIPDGTIDQADRQTLLGLYGGILASNAAIVIYIVAAMDDNGPVAVAGMGNAPGASAAQGHAPGAIVSQTVPG